MVKHIGLDFETYGGIDLPTHGLHRYVGHPTFRPLIASIKWRHNGQLLAERYEYHRDPRAFREFVGDHVSGSVVCPHNASFEDAVLKWLGIDVPAARYVDSAVVARAAGAAGKLEAAGPQLLGIDKVEAGKHLMRQFSIPSKEQVERGDLFWDATLPDVHPKDWDLYGYYCDIDAELGLRIVEDWGWVWPRREGEFQAVTMEMNQLGWPVDIELVEEMQRRYHQNVVDAEAEFRSTSYAGAADLNFSSHKQQVEWVRDRGIKANSFDEQHVKSLLKRISDKFVTLAEDDPKREGYAEVAHMLRTKQILGGASLKKLATILDTVVITDEGARAKDQYLHIGAGATWRTTGRSIQMQNLKRLDQENIGNMDELLDEDVEWDNETMAKNLRQTFTSSHPDGFLLVGDFSSVESRGLAWAAKAEWKLRAFRVGKDLYKVQAEKIFHCTYDEVTKPQRQIGKVGELSCGYQAGGPAVHSFAAKMGVEFTPAEAAQLVKDWRGVNPEALEFWAQLDNMLRRVFELNSIEKLRLPDGFVLSIRRSTTPSSLEQLHPGCISIMLAVEDPNGDWFMKRFIHGLYQRGNNIGYYKPSELKSGDLWKNHYRDQKTKEVVFYTIYGGKLTGIFVQSFCRELFMRCMVQLQEWAKHHSNVDLIGQFHDELVVDWRPGGPATISRDEAMADMDRIMSDAGLAVSFPLAAEIKYDYRYTK